MLGTALPPRLPESSGAIRYVSITDGNDTFDGTAPTAQGGSVGPWLTIAKAVSTLTNGQTCRIRGGSYPAGSVVINNVSGGSAAGQAKTLEAFPGETVVVPKIIFQGTSSYWRIRNLVCDGNLAVTGDGLRRGVGVKIDDTTNHVELYGLEAKNYQVLTDANSPNPQGFLQAGISPDSIHWYNCYAHDNGRVGGSTLDHGFYISLGTNTVVANCISVNNAAYGFQVYPSLRHAIFVNCLGDGSVSRAGMIIGGDTGVPANDTGDIVVRNCIFSNNAQFGLDLLYPVGNVPDIGVGSVNNCLFFNNPSGDTAVGVAANPTYAGNISGLDPKFSARAAKNFRPVAVSPCVHAGDASYTPTFDFTGTARVNADIGPYALPMAPPAHSQATSANTATPASVQTPKSDNGGQMATKCYLTARTNGAYVTLDGSTPTAANGIELPVGVRVGPFPVPTQGNDIRFCSANAAAASVLNALFVA